MGTAAVPRAARSSSRALFDDLDAAFTRFIHDRVVFLRPDVADALQTYLIARGRVIEDPDGEPMLAAVCTSFEGRQDYPFLVFTHKDDDTPLTT